MTAPITPAPSAIRVYVNGAGLNVPVGATALEAVRARDANAAEAVEQGTRVITDDRGLRASPDARLSAGSILRVIASRTRADADDRTLA